MLSLETAEEDTLCFLDSVDSLVDEDYAQLYIVNASPEGHSSKSDIQAAHFSQLTREDVLGIVDVYRKDFELYEYLGSEVKVKTMATAKEM